MKRRYRGWLYVSVAMLAGAFLWLWAARPRQQPTRSATAPSSPRVRVVLPTEQVTVPPSQGSISGFVRSDKGKRIKDARVCASTVSSEVFWTPKASCASTDGTGHYSIAPLAGTSYVVSASADGFQSASALFGGNISLTQGEAKTGVDIALWAGGAKVSGRVLDATGGPIAGATIAVLRQATPHDTVLATSGPDGRFALWIAAGPITVLADAHAYARMRVAHIAPSSDLMLIMMPGSALTGRVVAKDSGAPVAGVEVRAVRQGGWNNPAEPAAISDSEGGFAIHGLEPSTYTLIGEGTGWYGELGNPISIGLAQSVGDITLPVSAARAVMGTVIRRDNAQPCTRGSVTLGPPEIAIGGAPTMARPAPRIVPTIVGNVEADGTVRFNAVPAGGYQVDVACTDFILADGPTTLEVGAADLKGLIWKVDPGVRVIVHAFDESGEAAGNAHLRLSNDPDKSPRGLLNMSMVTDSSGKYEVAGLAPGLYTLRPDDGYLGAPVAIDAHGPGSVDAAIHLTGRGSILVTVQTPAGVGVDQVSISAEPVNDSPPPGGDLAAKAPAPPASIATAQPPMLVSAQAAALGNGRFQIGPLAAGSYRVLVNDGINPPAGPTDWPGGIVRVSANAAQAKVVLHRTGIIRGRVVDTSGQGWPDVWVTADCPSRAGREQTSRGRRWSPFRPSPLGRVVSDQEGRFQIDGLESDATCTVQAEQPGGVGGIAKDVHPGDETVVRLPTVGALSGTATLADGSPVTSFTVSVHDPESGLARSETLSAVDGRWSLARVPPGRLSLSAFEPTGGAAQARIELASGEQRAGIALQFSPLTGQNSTSDQNP